MKNLVKTKKHKIYLGSFLISAICLSVFLSTDSFDYRTEKILTPLEIEKPFSAEFTLSEGRDYYLQLAGYLKTDDPVYGVMDVQVRHAAETAMTTLEATANQKHYPVLNAKKGSHIFQVQFKSWEPYQPGLSDFNTIQLQLIPAPSKLSNWLRSAMLIGAFIGLLTFLSMTLFLSLSWLKSLFQKTA